MWEIVETEDGEATRTVLGEPFGMSSIYLHMRLRDTERDRGWGKMRG